MDNQGTEARHIPEAGYQQGYGAGSVYVMRKAENQLRPEGDSQTWAGNILLIPLFAYGGYRLPCGHEKMPDADKSKSNQSNKEESRWRLTHGS